MKDKSITVIIPVYNSRLSIEKCLESISQQTRVNLISRIILIDDGSNDNSASVIESLIPRLNVEIVIISQSNHGVSYARNRGIEVANTEWIAFLDADDLWVNDKLELQEKIIDKNNVYMIGGNATGKLQRIGLRVAPLVTKVKCTDMLFRSFPQTSTVLIKKKCIEKFNGFDENQKYCEDMNLFVKVAYTYNYYHLNKQLIYFGGGKPQIGSASGLSSNLPEMNKGAIKNLNDFMNMGIISKPQFEFYYCWNAIKYLRRIAIAYSNRRK